MPDMETKFSFAASPDQTEVSLFNIETQKPLIFRKNDVVNEKDNDDEKSRCARYVGCECRPTYWFCPCCRPKRKPSHRRSRRRKHTCAYCCRRTIAFLFSRIGLCSLVVAYSVAGGLMFSRLESPNELRERNKIIDIRRRYVASLWNCTRKFNILHPKNWTYYADKLLLEFQRDIYNATKERGWDGKEGERELQWSFTGSLLYSVTVITTIGYGNIAPKTPYGRLVTIFYAMVGIPLTLLCLANLGSSLGDCFRFLYKHTCRCFVWACLPARYQARNKQAARTCDERTNNTENMRSLEKEPDGYTTEWCDLPTNETDVSGVGDDDDESEEMVRVRVPISICFLVMAIYILCGAWLFSHWENWPYLVGSYFCFITLSTIGFGDFVPGTSVNSWSNKQKTVFCVIYLILGLSLIAMCFNLLQEEVRMKFRWLAEKLRLIERTGE